MSNKGMISDKKCSRCGGWLTMTGVGYACTSCGATFSSMRSIKSLRSTKTPVAHRVIHDPSRMPKFDLKPQE